MASTPLQRLSIFVAANETFFEPLKLVFPFILAVNPQPRELLRFDMEMETNFQAAGSLSKLSYTAIYEL